MLKNKASIFIGLILALGIPLIFGNHIPLTAKSFFYAFSLSFKAILLFVLPFIIFCFVFSCLLSFKTGVFKLVSSLIVCIFLSNLIAISCGVTIGYISSDFFTNVSTSIFAKQDSLTPMWTIHVPQLIKNEYALISGFIFGILFSIQRTKFTDSIAKKLNFYANFFLSKIFVPFIPLFIFGLICKLQHESILNTAIESYGPYFLIIVGSQVCYMIFIYSVASNFQIKKTIRFIKNVFPATITGFSTSSSAASLPVLILCSNKNAEPKIVETILPATINTHTLGSAIGISILIMTTLKMSGISIEFFQLVKFIFAYAFAKFAVAGVPGGVIVVIYPLLESILGFSPEILGIMTAMYMLFDPFGTAINVTGNGAFVIIFEKIYKKMVKKR